MTYPNPHYDPDWKARHDAHAAQRDHAREETHRLTEAGDGDSEAYAQASALWKTHQAECQAAIEAQHATVQDYAAWLFQFAPMDSEARDIGIPLPVVDFETLRTMQEARAAWSRVSRLVEVAADEKRRSLPIGQPDGLTAFADATAPTLRRIARDFGPYDLCPDGRTTDPGVSTLMTIDERADGTHICFTDLWRRGSRVTHSMAMLATAVYREASMIVAQSPEGGAAGAWIGRLLGRQQAPLDPARFHFYEHTPPRFERGREEFQRVSMICKDGEFQELARHSYRVIPHAIQSGRFECALHR